MEWYAAVRDKYCTNDMLRTSDTGEITCMFMPHNQDPDKFNVPTTWRKADDQAEKNRRRGIKTAMPTATEIQRSMGADQEKAQQLYTEFADYAAQRLAEYDKRDREHLDVIGASVERSMAKNRMAKIEQNDFVYISMRAPPHFRSCTMYSSAEKKARLQEMLTDNALYNKRVREIRRTMKELPKRKGFVADAVKDFRAKQEEQDRSRKRSHRALDGAATHPVEKRAVKLSDFAHATKVVTERSAAATKKPDLPKVIPLATKIKLVIPRHQRLTEPAAKKMPERPPLRRRRKTDVPPVPTKEPVVSPSSLRSAPDGDAIDPANCACAAAGPVYEDKARFEVPAPPDVAPATRTLSPPPAMPAAAAAGPEYDDTKRFPKDDADCKRRNDAAMQQKDRIGEKRETGESESVPKRYKTYPR